MTSKGNVTKIIPQCMFKSLSSRLANGLAHMPKLRHFSCKHDCNDAILEALVVGCSDTLVVLDVENSKVGDH